MRFYRVILLALICLASPVQAELYKCNGTWSNVPCDESAKPVQGMPEVSRAGRFEAREPQRVEQEAAKAKADEKKVEEEDAELPNDMELLTGGGASNAKTATMSDLSKLQREIKSAKRKFVNDAGKGSAKRDAHARFNSEFNRMCRGTFPPSRQYKDKCQQIANDLSTFLGS